MANEINGFGGMILFFSYLECTNNSIRFGRFVIIFKGPIKMIEKDHYFQ
jgi:hypothetical protein